MPEIKDPAHCWRVRTFPKEIASTSERVDHSRMKQDLSTTSADVRLDGDEGDIIALADTPFNLAPIVKIATAPWASRWTLNRHHFTRVLKSTVHRAGSGL